jgi:hypothetical protein
MSNFFLYTGVGLSRRNLICILSYFLRLRNFGAIKYAELGNKSFPFWKREAVKKFVLWKEAPQND